MAVVPGTLHTSVLISLLLAAFVPNTVAPTEPVEPAGLVEQTVSVSQLPSNKYVVAVGDYLVGDTDDMLLSGHPDIRY